MMNFHNLFVKSRKSVTIQLACRKGGMSPSIEDIVGECSYKPNPKSV
jgi:hypothetical protein